MLIYEYSTILIKGDEYMSKKIHLSLDDDLFEMISSDAEKSSVSVNVHITNMLEKLYRKDSFDYETVLSQIISEAYSQNANKPFVLAELSAFSELCIAQATQAKIKPNMARVRIAKSFNVLVQNGKLETTKNGKQLAIYRHINKNGELAFRNRAAVFILKEKE